MNFRKQSTGQELLTIIKSEFNYSLKILTYPFSDSLPGLSVRAKDLYFSLKAKPNGHAAFENNIFPPGRA